MTDGIYPVDVTNQHDWQATARRVVRHDGIHVVCKCARCGLEFERLGLVDYPLWWAGLTVPCEVQE